jgi:tetratricopeptide (TPR) repeat protein
MMSNPQRRLREALVIDDRSGPYYLTAQQAEAIIEGALKLWNRGALSAGRLRLRKALLLTASLATLSSAAAAFYIAIELYRSPLVQLSALPLRLVPKPSISVTAITRHTNSTLIPPSASQTTTIVGSDQLSSRLARSAPRVSGQKDLLKLANRLRGERQWRAAERYYREVFTVYPDSSSAYVALVAAADLRFDHLDDIPGALALYRQAISQYPAGALDPEARFGIARCYSVLGDKELETGALQELLQKHSSGLIAERAQNRLDAIQ